LLKKFNIMKKILLSLLISILITQSYTQAQKGYYDGTEGLTGYELKTALYNIIKGHNTHSYDDLYDGYETTDVDNYYENDGTVLDMYSENPTGVDPYNWTHNADHCGNYSNEGDCFNREHLFPQGFFNSASPMVSDIHFVVPSDGKVNGMRNNYPFGEVGSASWTSLNGSKRGSCSSPGYSGTVFEPIDEFKGDIARMMLYFVTRYQTQLSGFDPSDGNNPLDGSSTRGYEQWHIDLLLKWHDQDPVSQREIDRNNAAYGYQNNRNPYIDHPEWVHCVWEGICTDMFFTSSPVTDIVVGHNYSYAVEYTGEGATLTCEEKPSWLTFSSNTLSGTPTTIGDYDVSLKLTDSETTLYQNYTISVSAAGFVTIIDEDMEPCPTTGFSTYNVASNKDWTCADGYYYINAYEGDVASNDWLLLPSINFNTYEDVVLSFDTWTQYEDTDAPRLKLRYSTDYPGSGNPESYTWANLSFTAPSANSQTWTSSGNVNMPNLSSDNVYIAYNYTSSGTGGGTSTVWRVDNILMKGYNVSSVSNIINEVSLYPNPANNSITIENVMQISNISIYNTLGQKVYEDNFSKNKIIIDISNLNNGLYFLKTSDINGKTNVNRFIKK